MTKPLEAAYADELATYSAARANNEQARAWQYLERAHILGQLRMGLHIDSHLHMLGYAIHLRQPREVLGQVIRLFLAPLGNVTGRLPWGNSGRSHVSAFIEMDIPDDLKAIVAAVRR